MKSPEIDKIASALSKAQGEMKPPTRNKKVTVKMQNGGSYDFEYADLSAIAEAVREPLAKNELSYTHLNEMIGNDLFLVTYLMHSSGQFLSTLYPLPRAGDAKTLGGAITYGKRYCLSELTGCVADDDLDADPTNTTDFKDKKPKNSAPKNTPPSTGATASVGNTSAAAAPKQQPAAAAPKIQTEEELRAIQENAKLKKDAAALTAAMRKWTWTNADVSSYLMKRFGKPEFKVLDQSERDELIKTVAEKAASVAESELGMFQQ